MNVLHIIPAEVFDNTYHGAYKDTIARVRWFEAHADRYTQVRPAEDHPAQSALADLPKPDVIFVEYTRFPRIIRGLGARFPHATLCVRAQNVEPLQFLHNIGWWPRRGPLWVLYGMARLLWRDIQCRRHADFMFAINDWERRRYWQRLPGRARVEWLPYYCPDHLIPSAPPAYEERRIIACLPTSRQNRKSTDLVRRFQRLAEGLSEAGAPYDFVVTGDLSDWDLPACPHVTCIGFVENLSELLGRCRAVALLSPLGYGFKTTISDALAAGARVLAHPAICRRSPSQVRPGMLSVDTARGVDPAALLDRLRTPPEQADVHERLRGCHHDRLAALLAAAGRGEAAP